MKIAYNEATASKCSTLEQDLILCSQEGFEYIELRFDMLEQYLESHTLTELAEFFRNSSLRPHALNAVYIPEALMEVDWAASWPPFAEQFERACRIAGAIGSGYIIVVCPLSPDRMTPYPRPEDYVERRCRDLLGAMGDIAGGSGVRICFELVGADYSGVRSIAGARRIVEVLDRDEIGYVFDAFNIFMNRDFCGYGALADVCADRIFMVHVNDSDTPHRSGLTQSQRCFCGGGYIDLKDFLGSIRKTGYNEAVSVEVFRPEYWELTASEVIREAYRTTKRTLELFG